MVVLVPESTWPVRWFRREPDGEERCGICSQVPIWLWLCRILPGCALLITIAMI